jgi:beta-fructofuranosidase
LTLTPDTDFTRETTLSFNPCTETFSITRPAFTSTSGPLSSNLINTAPELAPHTLFTTSDDNASEPLTIHVFRDSSVLEVFVNGGRTAVSTRLYAAEENLGIRFFVAEDEDVGDGDGCDDGISSKSELIYAQVWDGIGT